MRVTGLRNGIVVSVVLALSGMLLRAQGQDAGASERTRDLSGAAASARMQAQLREGPAFVSGAVTPQWSGDSQSFTYVRAGERHRFDVATRTDTVAPVGRPPEATGPTPQPEPASSPRSPAGPRIIPCPAIPVERGRQRACEASPNLAKKAYYRDRNLYLSNADGSDERAITTDGSDRARVKNGVASWVYGEELDQPTAIWWSPDSRRVAFYRFDESRVQDYYLALDQTRVQSRLDVEAYPKAGTDNPVADVLVFDVDTRQTTRLDVRDGRPFADEVVGHYVYGVQWAPDGQEIRLFRTDRRQQHLEYAGCDPQSGRCRVIFSETWTTGWVENRPTLRPLADGTRFIVALDRTGWRNYYLGDYTRGILGPITRLSVDAGAIVRIDEPAGMLYYMARDGDHRTKLQLHRVGLDGRDDVRLTDPQFTHAVTLSPDGRYFVDVYQRHDSPPASRVVNASGSIVAEIATSDLSRFDQLGLRRMEQFSYLAGDGKTRLYGTIAFPSTFNPAKKYPVLLSVYAGPEYSTLVPSETFTAPGALAEYGCLVLSLETRAAPGMGRRVLDSLYLKLGQTEIDDLANGVRALRDRPYVDPARVGIYGTSYGGYAALMALLRYPDVFAAASVSSAPTDWRHYDTIYTERYMWTPQGNPSGYDAGSAMTYADQLRGRLLLYYGTADNNVHPSNSLQLIQALNRAGKRFDVQVGADLEHSAVPMARMMDFFVDTILAPSH